MTKEYIINYSLLEQVIEKSGKSNEYIADALGLSRQGWLNKRNGKTDFTVVEAQAFSDAFGLTDGERLAIFLP